MAYSEEMPPASGSTGKARLGRPPDTSSAETRGRLIDVARASFAKMGYETTTNRSIAADAGITTGAIYHYFDSKQDIFHAVLEEAEDRVYRRFRQGVADHQTFIGKIGAVLEAAHELNLEDPTLAKFLGSARLDLQRVPGLQPRVPSASRPFFNELIDHGVETGEIPPENATAVNLVLRTITTGLTQAVSSDPTEHRTAIDGVRALLDGKLIKSAS